MPMACLSLQAWPAMHVSDMYGLKNGAPEEIRTPNLLIRSQMLYPIELRARISVPG